PSLRRAPRPALRGNQAKRRAKPRPGHGKPGKGAGDPGAIPGPAAAAAGAPG
ncbi:unnamed protein product, partial [Effrenium voratum]